VAAPVVAVDHGCGPGWRRQQRARAQVAWDKDRGWACTAPCSPVDGGWHRWPRSTAEFHGWGSVAPDPDRVSITPIGASTRSPAPTPTSVPSRRRSSAKAARRGGVERAAPRRPREPQDGPRPGRHGWLGSPSATGQRMLAATARLPPGGGASVRSPADHRSFRRSAARSSVDHPPLGGAAGAEPRDTKEATRRPRRAAAPIPDARKGTVCATRSSHPVRQPQEPRTREQHPAPDLAAAPSRPDTYPAAGRSDPWVTVAGPAGPAPPAATCGRPQARPASA
jgi:hypothetical protein